MGYKKLLKKMVLPTLLVCTSLFSFSIPVFAKDTSSDYTFIKKDLKSGKETTITLENSEKDNSYNYDDESNSDETTSYYVYNDDEILDYDGDIDDLDDDDYSEILDNYYKNKKSNNTIKESNSTTTDSQISVCAILGRDNRDIVEDTTDKPYSSICFLDIVYEDDDDNLRHAYGTGFVNSDNVVVTAAHCLYREDLDKFVEYVRVTPGRNGDDTPYGRETSRTLYVPEKFKDDGDERYDYGVIRLNNSIGDECGNLSLTSLDKYVEDGYELLTAGYPSPKDYDYQMYECTGDVDSYTSRLIRHDMDTEGGQSGSPILVEYKSNKYKVVGIHSGYDGDRDINRGVRINSAIKDLVDEASES